MNLEVSENDFEVVWERVKILTGWSKYKDLAEFFDTSVESVSGMKRRGKFNLEWARRIAKEYGSYTDWIMDGEGPIKRLEKPEVYDSAPGWSPSADNSASASFKPPQTKKDALNLVGTSEEATNAGVQFFIDLAKSKLAGKTPDEIADIIEEMREAIRRQEAKKAEKAP